MLSKMLRCGVILFGVGCVVLFFMWHSVQKKALRYQNNQEILLDTIQSYEFRDSLSAASIGVLKLERDELLQFRQQDAKLIKDLGLRLKRVNSISKVATQAKYDIGIPTIPPKDSALNHKSMWVDYKVLYRTDTIYTSVVVYDTIHQVLHRIPRFKFLGIWFGTKGVRQEIVSSNPHSKIIAAEYLEILR